MSSRILKLVALAQSAERVGCQNEAISAARHAGALCARDRACSFDRLWALGWDGAYHAWGALVDGYFDALVLS